MGERDVDASGNPLREQTDESLRTEREKGDAHAVVPLDTAESVANEVVRVARQRADQVVQQARYTADSAHPTQSPAAEGIAARARSRADDRVSRERTGADATLAFERTEQKRYLAEFLASERDATDEDLLWERAHADTSLAARDEFLATVSHDLRSLLNGLSLGAGLLAREAPAGEAGDAIRRYAESAQRTVARMTRLVGDLLDITSIEAGKLSIVPEQLEVHSLLREVIETFGPIAAAKGITLDVDTSGPPQPAWLDSGRILQVLANLVSNAIKFTQPGGRVSIRSGIEAHEYRFTVQDTGIGIPEAALPGVFERFRQVRRDRRGLGLGLYISKAIVEAHGGRIWVESREGSGSTFAFTVPLEPPKIAELVHAA